ncbi:hypothetical protein CPAST_c04550 [Clostridium pasteurianum DSM 525 = ATCC 6013]|jgi:hypothetical protein|uniref:Small, acid-soluble spore protein, alpha/beta type n=1 Tax=Clostridium pasteurianum DSM 525 = ATCC 6013 TaxID=1262449 RepID=A0A0H3J6H4_CLOPA|nr:hypothetical protein [Clostridium pasteurianum]AJA46555.1 hypothetical protein CPAST_c04550 [Clostridium pasteurianum DSM 525 = ATCC 6013]AJA50543.1 hypothetical protein CLPA_c04550 [Clostridium pasteurianum DSM 525 = ATCC 6013]AOZ73979.1 small, acid-soluble spore protein, alpha/beta type [Clostridium pasteurianum DSM 525 = ATCC 6013]AOZ77776.1 small, acid-soluble spore protein, alpha/beta type [Clostridium pasteurianum]ELP61127.1 hypothetical protein F502_01690 [Clostridium pasteurianum DS
MANKKSKGKFSVSEGREAAAKFNLEAAEGVGISTKGRRKEDVTSEQKNPVGKIKNPGKNRK